MSSRAISNNIAPKPRHFFVRGQPLNRGIFSSEAAGRGRKNAEVEGLAEDEKMPWLRGYIVGYSTRRRRIYNIYPLNRIEYSTWFIRLKDGRQRLADLLVYLLFLIEQKTKNLIKKCDISPRKFKYIEFPKMVSKRLYGHYLRTYEQF